MEVSEPELTALFAAWRQDIDSEPFRHAGELDAAVHRWTYQRRYLTLVVQLVADTTTRADTHAEAGGPDWTIP